MKVRFVWEGVSYEYDPEEIDNPTAKEIKHNTGWGLKTWGKEVDDMNPDALQALLFAAKRQHGDSPIYTSSAPSKPIAFYNVFFDASVKAMAEEIEAEKKADAEAEAELPTAPAPENPATPMPTLENSAT